jgi:hypothetical protein
MFFLSKGINQFLLMDDVDKVKQLKTYNLLDFFELQPTKQTFQKLNGHHLIFKQTSNGFVVFAKVMDDNDRVPFISCGDNLSLTFLLKLRDSLYYNYTNLDLENAVKIYYFSNRKLSTEANTFPLINLIGENNFIDESFVLTDTSQTEELLNLFLAEKDKLFGLVRIFIKADDPAHDILVEEEFTDENNVTTTQRAITNPAKSFEILLDNRKTTWRYIFNSNQEVSDLDDVEIEASDSKVLVSKDEQPLTSKGFVSIKHGITELPNPGINMIKPDELSNNIFSEIYM